uniref:Uncharacterized protein n=1 Tax=Rhizophora mucronata TaxID=61149 RepID=A0A2P2QYE2_RHIMU
MEHLLTDLPPKTNKNAELF